MRNQWLVLFSLAAGALAFSTASLWLNKADQRHAPSAQAGEVEDLRDPEKLRAVRISVVAPADFAESLVVGDAVDILAWRIVQNEQVPAIVARNIPVLEFQRRFDTLLLTVEADEWQVRKLQQVQEAGDLSFVPHGSNPLPPPHRVLDQPFDPDIFPWYHENAG